MKSDSIPEAPSTEVINAFGCKGKIERLQGGRGRCFIIQNCVFKPVENIDLHEWCCRLLMDMESKDFRVSKPINTRYGQFVYKGWSATLYEPGIHVNGRWDEKLSIAKLFQKSINQDFIDSLPAHHDDWSHAHDIIWNGSKIPDNIHSVIKSKINALLLHFSKIDYRPEIIHSDLCGNILFHDGLAPLVIDLSPAVAPANFAEAILIADAIAWEGAPIELIKIAADTREFDELLRRAVAFRVIVAGLYFANDINGFLSEYQAFLPIIQKLDRKKQTV